MSECAGPETIFIAKNFKKVTDDYLKSTGPPMLGSDMAIFMPDKDGNGEICFKGRNRFMGYFK